MSQSDAGEGSFSGRVVVLFGTQVFGAGVGIVNGILLARLLGPDLKGDYYILVLVPSTAVILLQLGLPQAFGFFAARGETAGILTKALVLTIALSGAAALALFALLPVLRTDFLRGIDTPLILLAFASLPLALGATFTTGIVMGRQLVSWYAAINMGYPIASTVLLVVLVGGLGPSVTGAIVVYLIVTAIQSIGFVLGAYRVAAATTEHAAVRYRDLFRYGLQFYPGSLTLFFSARADAYLIALLLADPSAPLGYYSMAVGLAELVFFFPNAVATLFFPHVAGSSRAESDSQVAMVSRVVMIVTTLAAVAVAPGAVIMIWLVLPAFGPSLPALFVLLPGVVALSATKVVYGYVTGIGMPGFTSFINAAAFALNIIANLVLIPRFGIVGASAASLVSYSASSVVFTIVGARLSGARVRDFWIPRLSDIRFIVDTTVTLAQRFRRSVQFGG